MAKHPHIATPGQEQYMRGMIEMFAAQRKQSLTAFSETIIGSTRLLDFHRGACLTNMLLTRTLIGLHAQQISATRETLLGPAEAPPERVLRDVPQRDDSHDGDPLGACVQCLIEAIEQLTLVCTHLSAAFTACIQAMREVNE